MTSLKNRLLVGSVLTLLALGGMAVQIPSSMDPGLKFDLSEPFCIYGGLLLGPLAGLLIVGAKNALHHLLVSPHLIGHFCNLWAVGTMTVVTVVVFRRQRQRNNSVIKALSFSLAAGTLARIAVMIVVNLFAIQHYGLSLTEAERYALTASLLFNLAQGIATSLCLLLVIPLVSRRV